MVKRPGLFIINKQNVWVSTALTSEFTSKCCCCKISITKLSSMNLMLDCFVQKISDPSLKIRSIHPSIVVTIFTPSIDSVLSVFGSQENNVLSRSLGNLNPIFLDVFFFFFIYIYIYIYIYIWQTSNYCDSTERSALCLRLIPLMPIRTEWITLLTQLMPTQSNWFSVQEVVKKIKMFYSKLLTSIYFQYISAKKKKWLQWVYVSIIVSALKGLHHRRNVLFLS